MISDLRKPNVRKVEPQGDHEILLVEDELDVADEVLLQQIRQITAEKRECHVWVDCSRMQCIRTRGFCHFINQLLLLRRQHLSVLLLNPSVQLLNILSQLRLKPLFRMSPSLSKAYEWLQQKDLKNNSSSYQS